MSVVFSECRTEHLSRLREFFGRVYRSDYILAKDEALLRWQFGGIDAWRPDHYHVKLALRDNVIVGCLGYIPLEVTIAGRRVRGAWTANWVVDPAYRRFALGPLLMSSLIREHDVTLVVGASAEAREILPRVGFTHYGALKRHVWVIDPAGAAELSGSDVRLWDGLEPVNVERDHAVERVQRFDVAVERIWDDVWGDGAGTRRSAAFLNWRYTAHPTFRYRLFQALSPGRPAGFAVYRVESVHGLAARVGRVVEFVAEPGSERCLLGALLEDARSNDVSVMDLFCSSTRVAPALERSRWLPEGQLPAEVPMLFQPIARGRRSIPFLGHLRTVRSHSDWNGWYVTKGDGDQDRPN